MKRLLLLTSVFISFACDINSYQDSQKKSALLNTAKTDSSAVAETMSQDNKETWQQGSFVDEFGDAEKGKFIKTFTVGTFTNSATSKETLYVQLLFTLKNAGLFLHEYGSDHPAEKFIGSGKIRLKNDQGKELTVFSYSEWNQEGGISVSGENYRKLRDFLSASKGSVKVVVYDDYSSTYNFVIDGTSFAKSFSSLRTAK
jgi:hypothetical protein